MSEGRVTLRFHDGQRFGVEHGYVRSIRHYHAALEQGQVFTSRIEDRWQSLGPLAALAGARAALEAAGYEVEVEQALLDAMASQSAGEARARELASVRADEVDRYLSSLPVAPGQRDTPRLYEYQRAGIAWLASRNRAILADDMGLGKTVQLAVAVPDGAPLVVVAPVLAMGNWVAELRKWRPGRSEPRILGEERKLGQSIRDTFVWPKENETVITAYSRLPEHPPTGLLPGTILVCDEAHNLKSLRLDGQDRVDTAQSSEQAAYFFRLGRAVLSKQGCVWLATGTPVMNDMSELRSMLQQADLFTDTYGTTNYFKDVFGIRSKTIWLKGGGTIQQIDWKRARPTEDALRRLSGVLLRRTKADALPFLPPKTVRPLHVYISQDAKTALDKLDSEGGLTSKLERERAHLDSSETVTLIRSEDERLRRRQDAAARRRRRGSSKKLTDEEKELLWGSKDTPPGLDSISRARQILARAKAPAVVAWLRENVAPGEPILVYSAHIDPLNELLHAFPEWETIQGSTSQKERSRIVADFQAGKIPGLALSIAAAGVAITLTRACKAVFLDRAWTPSANVQAEDRIHRISQFRPVEIVQVVADHAIDRVLQAILDRKAALIDQTVNAVRVDTSYTPELVFQGQVPQAPVLALPPPPPPLPPAPPAPPQRVEPVRRPAPVRRPVASPPPPRPAFAPPPRGWAGGVHAFVLSRLSGICAVCGQPESKHRAPPPKPGRQLTLWNPGPDERLRRLERAAACGDEDAARAASVERQRQGEVTVKVPWRFPGSFPPMAPEMAVLVRFPSSWYPQGGWVLVSRQGVWGRTAYPTSHDAIRAASLISVIAPDGSEVLKAGRAGGRA